MSTTPSGAQNVQFAADQILRAAAEVEAAETAIKAEIVRAAHAGQCDRIVSIVTRWNTMPAAAVLSPEHRLNDEPESR